jgi:hypothetical protein
MQQRKVKAKEYGGGADEDRKEEAAGCCVFVTCMVSFGRNYITDPTTVKLCNYHKMV